MPATVTEVTLPTRNAEVGRISTSWKVVCPLKITVFVPSRRVIRAAIGRSGEPWDIAGAPTRSIAPPALVRANWKLPPAPAVATLTKTDAPLRT